MILFLCSSQREAAALTAACDHRNWAAYNCTTIREFRPLAEKIQPRAIVVRHRLLDGYSDDVFALLNNIASAGRPRVIVLMSADRTTQLEARQIALGADCVLHDPVRTDILFEYLARYRKTPAVSGRDAGSHQASFAFAGAEVFVHEHRIVFGKRSAHIAPQEAALLLVLAHAGEELVPYPVLYSDLFGRRFDGDTSNCRVLLGKLAASFKRLGIALRPFIQVIPKSGYRYVPPPSPSSRQPDAWRKKPTHPLRKAKRRA